MDSVSLENTNQFSKYYRTREVLEFCAWESRE